MINDAVICSDSSQIFILDAGENVAQALVHTDVPGIVGVEFIFTYDSVVTDTLNPDIREIKHTLDHVQ